LLHHGSRRRGKQHLRDPGIPPISLSLSSFRPYSFFRRREGGKERTACRVKGCEGAQGRPSALITLQCHDRGGKSGWALSDAVRGLINQVYMPPLLLAHRASYDSTDT
jgi:hypothetical protein